VAVAVAVELASAVLKPKLPLAREPQVLVSSTVLQERRVNFPDK
jgi:hypothetical protein